MSSRLPEYVDPWRLTDTGKIFSARIDVAMLPRLAEAVLEPVGEVDLELMFDRDDQGQARVHGVIRAHLTLECQRCLGPMSYTLDTQLNLALVAGAEEAERLPDSYDPLLVEEPRIRLLDIVEDELLLSLPQVSRHAPEQCFARAPDRPAQQLDQDQDPETVTKKANPFAALAELKGKLN